MKAMPLNFNHHASQKQTKRLGNLSKKQVTQGKQKPAVKYTIHNTQGQLASPVNIS